MLTEFVKGRTIKEFEEYSNDDFLEEMQAPIAPARKKCALLALETLRDALGINKRKK